MQKYSLSGEALCVARERPPLLEVQRKHETAILKQAVGTAAELQRALQSAQHSTCIEVRNGPTLRAGATAFQCFYADLVLTDGFYPALDMAFGSCGP
jgi:hypothetical protein